VYAPISLKPTGRRYSKHFISKLSDGDAENSNTQTWLECAYACDYIRKDTFNIFVTKSKEVGRLINFMILNPSELGSGI
jgi:four helix bundle protein